jgi:hypothetical protein
MGSNAGGSAPRSQLVEDLRLGRFVPRSLADLAGHVVEFACDPFGSRYLLQNLDVCSDVERDVIFAEVFAAGLSLCSDSCGAYVVMRFFEIGTMEQRLKLVGCLHEQVLNLSLQAAGCRVVQKALETMPQEAKQAVARELDGHLMKCVQDQHGNHVVQAVIVHVKGDGLAWLLHSFEGNIVRLSTHPYGCRIVQRLLEHCTEPQAAAVLTEVLASAGELLRDSYGNYVIQHVMEHGKPEHRSVVLSHVLGKVLVLSLHKFASNVVERCLEFCSASEKKAIVDEILNPTIAVLRAMNGALPDETSSQLTPLQVLIRDQFGNYVAQRVREDARRIGERVRERERLRRVCVREEGRAVPLIPLSRFTLPSPPAPLNPQPHSSLSSSRRFSTLPTTRSVRLPSRSSSLTRPSCVGTRTASTSSRASRRWSRPGLSSPSGPHWRRGTHPAAARVPARVPARGSLASALAPSAWLGERAVSPRPSASRPLADSASGASPPLPAPPSAGGPPAPAAVRWASRSNGFARSCLSASAVRAHFLRFQSAPHCAMRGPPSST